jgi:hypothetical protein
MLQACAADGCMHGNEVEQATLFVPNRKWQVVGQIAAMILVTFSLQVSLS